MKKIFVILGLVVSLTSCFESKENGFTEPPSLSHTQSKHDEQIISLKSSKSYNFNGCREQFYQQTPPEITEKYQHLYQDSYALCFSGFAVLYSSRTKTPIYSAEYLDKARINDAKKMTRVDNFHEEQRLPIQVRSTLSDYAHSGYDRGHLSPNGDMANTSQQFDSFSLANIAPQNNIHNRGIWQDIEKDVRRTVLRYGDAYVITGTYYQNGKDKTIGNGVAIPSHFFKAVYVPKTKQSVVYFSQNKENGLTENLSLLQFKQKTGLDLMPSLR